MRKYHLLEASSYPFISGFRVGSQFISNANNQIRVVVRLLSLSCIGEFASKSKYEEAGYRLGEI
jgi:hypothetical protein